MHGINLIKLLKTLDLLGRLEGTTIEELQNELGIDRRPVYREIAIVEELGFPLYQDDIPFEKRKRWRLDESYLKKIKTLFASSSKFAKDYSGKEEIIEDLADAMLKNRVCRIKYHSF